MSRVSSSCAILLYTGRQSARFYTNTAASSATLVPNFVVQAQAVGWKVCVITTPQGAQFIDIPLLAQLTGDPVRSEYKRPEESDVLPCADAIVVFPATFNTINKWAFISF